MLQISNSELGTFQWCERHWMLAYFHGYRMRPERDRPVGEAKLGTRIHLALELWYGYGIDPLVVLKTIYDDARAAYPHDEDVERLNAEHDLALAMMEGYLDWVQDTGADEGLTVISVEEQLILPSNIPGVAFRAKLDQRVMRTHDGARLFLDHKTVGSFEHSTTLLHMNAQMRFYAMLDMLDAKRNNTQQRVDGGLWNMLRRSKRTARAKPPFYKRDEVRFNIDELRSTWMKANALVDRIARSRQQLNAGVDHRYVTPPNPSRDCIWRCAFVRICPLFDDGSNVEQALRDQYVKGDPYDYYENEADAMVKRLQGAH